MPESAVSEPPAKKHWKTLEKERREAEKAAELAGADKPPFGIVPAVEAAVAVAEPAPVPPAPMPPPECPGPILSPREFLIPFLTNNPHAVMEYNGQPNPVASLADACIKAYTVYLCLASESYAALYKQSLPVEKARVMPNLRAMEEMYRVATGA